MSIIKDGKIIAGNYKINEFTEATTENSGIIRIATDEEVQAGTNNTTAVTPLSLKNSLGTTKVPTKLSELENDENYVKQEDINNKYSGLPLLSTFWSSVPINDDRMHIKDGSVIDGSVYNGAFARLIELQTSNPELFCTDEEYQESIDTHGECGKFVMYLTSFKLPTQNSFMEGMLNGDTFGEVVEAGLPNITGSFQKDQIYVQNVSEAKGCIRETTKLQEYNVAAGSSGNEITRVTIDASKSNPIYSKSDTVQPQSMIGAYYIVLATGLTNNVELASTVEINNTNFFGESKYTLIDPQNISWLKSEGRFISSEPYPSFWNWLTTEYNNNNISIVTPYYYQFATASGTTFWLTHQAPKVGDKVYGYNPMVECGYVTVVNTDGSVVVKDLKNANQFEYTVTYSSSDKWDNFENYNNSTSLFDYYFIVDTESNTFRLPLLNGSEDQPNWDTAKAESKLLNTHYIAPVNGFIFGQLDTTVDGTIAYVGVNENVIGTTATQYNGADAYIPFFVKVNKGDDYYVVNNKNAGFLLFIPATGNGSLYYYVGETVVSPNIINATEMLNNRADINLSNVNVSEVGKNTELTTLMAHSALPSDRYIDLTLGATGSSYIAPADGWILITTYANSENTTNHLIQITIDGRIIGDTIHGSNMLLNVFTPITKNQQFTIDYTRIITPKQFRFYYLHGVSN